MRPPRLPRDGAHVPGQIGGGRRAGLVGGMRGVAKRAIVSAYDSSVTPWARSARRARERWEKYGARLAAIR